MVIKIPEKHCFPDFLKREVKDKIGYSLPDWEISVQKKDDIAWSVVLSFLISTNHRNRDDFSRRLVALTGCKNNLNLVKNAIKSFNPFRNRYSCFFNEALQQVVMEFKENLRWDSLRRVSDKLSAINNRLKCKLLHVWKDKYAFRYQIYPEKSGNWLNTIVMISSNFINEDNKTTGSVCNFLLDHDLGIRLKFASLRYFLKEAEIPRKILKKVEQVVSKEEPFLISLLHNDYSDVITLLYNSAYLVSKLAEAGFETDPKTAVSGGFSAFYHALDLGKIEVLYKMYYFSANNYCQTEESYGSPESCIINNLQQLEEIFSNDLEKFDTFDNHPEYHRIKKEYNDLLRFNEFLLEVNSELLKIKRDSIEEITSEATNRRDIILCILDTYTNFFQFNAKDSIVQSHLDDYLKFRNYYNYIDLATAILFFSNIIYLKERLRLENADTYSQMEISFYQTIYYSYFSDTTHCEKYFKNKLNSHNIFFIPLIRRLENIENIKKFSTNLRETIITPQNILKCVPEKEILSIFKSFPIFKNVIHLNRLKNYIDTALKIKVTDEKSVLVMQRVLQVIGEYVNPNNNNDFQRFLSLVLPENVSHVLLCTRKKLSHLLSYELKSKFECEKNLSLFRSVQKDIKSIYHPFNLVYNFYAWKESSELLKFTEHEMSQLRKLKHSSGNPDQLLTTFKEVDTEKLQIANSILYAGLYTDLFEIILLNAENKITGEIKWTGDLEETKNGVLNILWPLKKLIEMLAVNDCIAENTVSDILETMTLDEENINLKRKTDEIIRKCKDVMSKLQNLNPPRERKNTSLPDITNTERFLKVLKGFTFLSYEQKEDIRKEIPEKIQLDAYNVEKLIKSVRDGFSLNIKDENAPELQISYLSKTKRKKIFYFYENRKHDEILSELESTNPIAELEDIFSKNSFDKKKYEKLCEIMKFSEKTKTLLSKLVAGQNKKKPENNLRNLLNRIQLLKKILIEEKDEIHTLWLEVKRTTSKKHVFDKIVRHYLREPSLQASVEMLLIDCMSIFESQKDIENPWIKSANLYCGINLRNILCHGNPFLDRLCELLAPDDLATELIQIMLRLIKGEDAILAILELYERHNCNYSLLKNIIYNDDNEEYCELKDQILKCDDSKNYVELLKENTSSR